MININIMPWSFFGYGISAFIRINRMLGQKIGTGGSSGHAYLKSATEKHKVFSDFFNLSTFLIPRSKVPPLPANLQSKMNFNY